MYMSEENRKVYGAFLKHDQPAAVQMIDAPRGPQFVRLRRVATIVASFVYILSRRLPLIWDVIEGAWIDAVEN